VRSAQFTRTQQVLDLALKHREEVTDRGVVGVGKSHTMVSEDVAFCLKTFGRSQDFLFGHTLYTILANPVPREMWTAKPVAFGRILGQIRQGEYGSPYAKPHGWSIAAGLAGEGYANGGYPGIIIVSLLVGFVSGKAGKLATVGFYIPSYPVIVLSLGFYRMSTLFVRGDVHSAWVSMAYPILALVFALCVLSRVGCVLEVAARSQLPRFSAKDEVCCGR